MAVLDPREPFGQDDDMPRQGEMGQLDLVRQRLEWALGDPPAGLARSSCGPGVEGVAGVDCGGIAAPACPTDGEVDADTNAWTRLVSNGHASAEPEQIWELIDLLGADRRFRQAARLQTMERSRAVLEKLSDETDVAERVSIPAVDAVVLAEALLELLG